MAAQLNQLVAAIRNRLDRVGGVGMVYDSYAAPNLTEADFPVLVFSLGGLNVTTHFSDTIDQVTGTVVVSHHTLCADGTAAMRRIMEATYSALHRSNLTSTDWTSIQLRCVARGAIVAIGEGMYAQDDTYALTGNASV